MSESPIDIRKARNGGGSSDHGTRKVSSRRKALQDFYKINNDVKSHATTNAKKESGTEEMSYAYDMLTTSPEKLNEYLKSRPIESILKIRNQITGKLNSQNQTKKSIIYDNYYELIKLSQILTDIISGNSMQRDQSNGFRVLDEEKVKIRKDADYVDEILKDLSHFVTEEVSLFDSDFESVITSMKGSIADKAQSGVATSESAKTHSSSRIKHKDSLRLTEEINLLLKRDLTDISTAVKDSLISDIQIILKNLHVQEDELLIIQLNQLKSTLT